MILNRQHIICLGGRGKKGKGWGGQSGTRIGSHFLSKVVERQQVDESNCEGFVFAKYPMKNLQALNGIIAKE